MLLHIREKVHGLLASIVLVVMCILFGLWGIQNYLGGGKENPVVTVGDKDFFQNDVNRAYHEFAQSVANMKLDEDTIRKQAMYKLVRDEVLLQYVQKQNLLISDETAGEVIKSLPYFQKDGKFDKGLFQSLLKSQDMTSDEFINRIKKALLMEQFQRTITDSNFVTPANVAAFFKIQNQKRDLEYVDLPLEMANIKLSDEDTNAYYQAHLNQFQTEEQMSIDYVELSLEQLATQVQFNEEQLKAYYEEQKPQFSTKERRRISHILFAFTKDPSADQQALQKALKAKEELKTKKFEVLASELSDDKASAKKGGDLGLFNAGVMEKSFEDAATKLKLGEVSEPIKSAFGYHLIKITELAPGEVKSYEAVKPELIKSYQKAQAESKFGALGEKLTEVSYENPDNLETAAKILGVSINKSQTFTRNAGEGIAADEKVRLAAFSEDVLKGNNSEPIEIAGDKLVVLRMASHQPSMTRELKDVKLQVILSLQLEKGEQQAEKKAEQIKAEVNAGKSFAEVAAAYHLPLKKLKDVSRTSKELPPNVIQAIFKAPKPQNGHPTLISADNNGKILISIDHVTEGEMTDADKSKQAIIQTNMSNAFGKAEFEALVNALQAKADITMHPQKQ